MADFVHINVTLELDGVQNPLKAADDAARVIARALEATYKPNTEKAKRKVLTKMINITTSRSVGE